MQWKNIELHEWLARLGWMIGIGANELSEREINNQRKNCENNINELILASQFRFVCFVWFINEIWFISANESKLN